MPTLFESMRQRAEQEAANPQQRNRRWWEALPMTYEAWEKDDRGELSDEALLALRQRFLDANPWLRDSFDFVRYRGRAVLEIGCGSGAAACHIAASGGRVLAVDLTEAAIRLTRRHGRLCGQPLSVAQMDGERLALADRSVDDVFSWGVLHHSTDTLAAFAEVARVLRPDGTALLMVYNRWSARYWIKGLIWLLLRGRLLAGDTMDTVQRHYTDGFHHRHFSPPELRRVLQARGLRVERTAVSHMSKKMLPLVPRALDEALKRRVGWLLIVEARKA